MTSIEWTHVPGYKGETWNPTLGCERAGKDCLHCYAATLAHRGLQEAHRGLTTLDVNGIPRFNGTIRGMPQRLSTPIRWRQPRAVFVDSMSDLFHPRVRPEYVAAVFGVMAATPQHIYMILTKHPDHARKVFNWMASQPNAEGVPHPRLECTWQALRMEAEHHPEGDGGPLHTKHGADPDGPWPLPNVWIGCSAGYQQALDERAPHLAEIPAAVRFLSLEPLLENVDASRVLGTGAVHQVIVGGESGNGARPFNVGWARNIRDQCTAYGPAFFCKQLGSDVRWSGMQGGCGDGPDNRWPDGTRTEDTGEGDWRVRLNSRKGGDADEWPPDIRIRQWPKARP